MVRLTAGDRRADRAGREIRIDGRPAIESDRVRDRIGQFGAEVEALSALTYANITRWSRGTERMHDAAMAKLMFSELNLEIARFAVELGGEAGVLVEGDPSARSWPLAGRVAVRACVHHRRRQLGDHAQHDRRTRARPSPPGSRRASRMSRHGDQDICVSSR